MYKKLLKRLLDILIAGIMLVLVLPLFLIAVLIILISDGWPVMYFQERVGYAEKSFSIFKFRTMRKNMEAFGATTVKNDPRFFLGSRLLRKLKIDELPQLLNIIKGDMSLVGPRPTVRSDLEKMSPQQKVRFTVQPGLTGLAQISGNTSLTWPQRLKFDIDYVESLSFLNDMAILYKTGWYWLTNNLDSESSDVNEWGGK